MKKSFSLILCLSVLMLSLSTISLAAHENSLIITETVEDSWIVDVTGEALPEISDSADKKYYLQGQEYALHYDAYSQLDQAQKVMYDAVVENVGKLSFTINFADGVFAYSNFNQGYFTELMNALCTDRPDVFYYAGYSIGNGKLHSNGKYIKSMTYNVGVYDTSYYTSSNLPGYYNALMSKVNSLASAGTFNMTNRYNFIKSVHDYLAGTVYYPDLNSSDYKMSAHDAYGALVEGRAVCQGYSDAVKLICDYYGIPCVCISGTSDGVGHMWNAIQMEDGKWYFVDLTWDDQGSYGIYYDFFLVGSKSTNTYFGGKQFSVEHVNDADLCLPNLQYATTAYNRTQNHNTLFMGTYNSRYDADFGYLYLSVFDYLKTPVFYNGMSSDASPVQGNSFTVNDNGTSRVITSIIVGDPNGDGRLNASDYRITKNRLLSADNSVYDSESAACDVNGDGVVDALDLAQLHLVECDGITTVTNFELG
ncbi:MAG: hypothetical protein J6Q83_04165 [Clostridia bacterium]|nr:hypothetical protein [Clostridia bacterium]